MAEHVSQNPRWWERHDALMWTVATAAEHWQWVIGPALLVLFALTDGGGATR